MTEHIRITYYLAADGYIQHPKGEFAIHSSEWERLKAYHVGIGLHFISVNASGGSESVAAQILASKVLAERVGEHPNLTMLWTDDE